MTSDLGAMRRAIQERRERVAEYERRERGLFDAIRSVDEAVRALSADLERARRQAETARTRLRELEASSADLEVRLARTKRALAGRAGFLDLAGVPLREDDFSLDLPAVLEALDSTARLCEELGHSVQPTEPPH